MNLNISGVHPATPNAHRYREDALVWSLRFHEGRQNATTEGVVSTAKAFEAYVYGGDER